MTTQPPQHEGKEHDRKGAPRRALVFLLRQAKVQNPETSGEADALLADIETSEEKEAEQPAAPDSKKK